ncbi:MAG TPA: type IV pili methyl-accepting chemotaxis transducer N-terminal domain-containing protein [Oscillatoriaceae cyanobacterium M33_DOE_052]|nr:type IV pili methyl-accepting chemotaxis transducer N-terminal domain-containing protein [Oscillatoriaceae cyanobacterium M33_DOE_052]
MTNDARVINYSGLLRGETQRIVKLELLKQPEDELIKKLDEIALGLINGDKNLSLPPAKNPDFKKKIDAVFASWNQLKSHIIDFRLDPENHQEQIGQISEEHWKLTDEAVFAAENYSRQKIENLKMIFILLGASSIIVLLALLIATQIIQIKLRLAIKTMAESSTEIAALIHQQEVVATRQEAAVKTTTNTMQNLKNFASNSVESATVAAKVAYQVIELAKTGNAIGENAAEQLQILQNKIESMHEECMDLSRKNVQISKVSILVKNLADQTNLLALNAAVEAARSNHHGGKGFTVVASEIRQLADESKKSADKISLLVTDIQVAINSAVSEFNELTKIVKQGLASANKSTIESFHTVVGVLSEVFDSSEQISNNAKEQANAIQEVVNTMNSLHLGASESTSGIRQAKNGIDQLKQVAVNLDEIV